MSHLSQYRWEEKECIDERDGAVVGSIAVWTQFPERWQAARGKERAVYASKEQAMAAVEDGMVHGEQITEPQITEPQRKNMIKEITTDVKGFISENRNIIYWLALAFLADHFFFGGAFRQRLNALVERMIGRVEKQLEAKA